MKAKKWFRSIKTKLANFWTGVREYIDDHIWPWYFIGAIGGLLIDIPVVLLVRKNKRVGKWTKDYFKMLYGWKIQ